MSSKAPGDCRLSIEHTEPILKDIEQAVVENDGMQRGKTARVHELLLQIQRHGSSTLAETHCFSHIKIGILASSLCSGVTLKRNIASCVHR